MALNSASLLSLLAAAVVLSACAGGGRTYSGTYAGDVSPSGGAQPSRLEARSEPRPEFERTQIVTVAEEPVETASVPVVPAASPSNPSVARSLTESAPQPEATAVAPAVPAQITNEEIAESLEPSPTAPPAAPAEPRPSALAQSAPGEGSSVLASAPETPPEPVAATTVPVASPNPDLPTSRSTPAEPRVQARAEQARGSVLAQAVPEVGADGATPRPPAGSDLGGVLPRPAAPSARPSLGSVPEVPRDLPTAAERSAIIEQLEADRELLRQTRDAPPGGVGMLPTETGTGVTTAPALPGGSASDPAAQLAADQALLTGGDGGVPVMPADGLPLRTGSSSTVPPTVPVQTAARPASAPPTAAPGPATTARSVAPASGGPEAAASGAQSVFSAAFIQSGTPAGSAPVQTAAAPSVPQPAPAAAALPVSAATDLATTIRFSSGSASLTGPALGAIDQLGALAMADNLPIRIVGYAALDRGDGSYTENTRLAMARANAVAGRLIGRGLSPTRVRVESAGVAEAGLEEARIFLP